MSTCSLNKLPVEIVELIICDSSFNMKNLKDFANVCEKWKCIIANFISRIALDFRTPVCSVYFISMFSKPIYYRHNFIYRFVDFTLLHRSTAVNWVNSIHNSSLDYINNCFTLCNFTMRKFGRKFVENSFRLRDLSYHEEAETSFIWNVTSTTDPNLQSAHPGTSLEIHKDDQKLMSDTFYSNLNRINLSIDFSDLEKKYTKQKLNYLPRNFIESWELCLIKNFPKFLIASIKDSTGNEIFEHQFSQNRFSSNKFDIKLLFSKAGSGGKFAEFFPDFFESDFVLRDRVNIDKFIREDVIKRLSPSLVIILKLRSIRSLVKNRKAKNILRLKLDRCFKSITYDDSAEFSSDEVDNDKNNGDSLDSDTEDDTDDDTEDDSEDDSEYGEYDQDFVYGESSSEDTTDDEFDSTALETKYISSARKLKKFFYANDPAWLSTSVCLHFLNGQRFFRKFYHSFVRDLKIRLVYPIDDPMKLGTDLTIIRTTKMSTLTKLNSCEFISRVTYSKTFDSFYFSEMKAYFDFFYE